MSEPLILRPALAETHRTEAVPDKRYPGARNKAAFGPDTQIRELKAHIELKLRQIANLVSRGRYDQAGLVADIVSENRARLVLLVTELQAQEHVPEPAPVLVKPKNKAVRKPKRYPRWGDK
jgi:hypothetical protein